ncbi:pro-sigmaK processing inhibitor BofA family protein [Anaeromicropila herbilytica]|uniref:Pro-sigmaK processing inhibitor BofA n=1 Tax=Anaeromicropila herbilytica TaxID=2785025 RepID=A0A7R7EQJ6_9FIRM|nr:pro-sigmaK processing inhibitor BofA family protein [Anaeromicropila herbilytica]BCN32941.1 hypothetical protein bsdtb5_42360 [Anaeromicropila herbilytica]
MENYIFIAIITVCVIALIVSFISHRIDTFINFILRITVGIVAIYFLNMIFDYKNISATVGINAYSIFTIGCLGTPGFLLMYALSFYYSFVGKV